MLGRVRKNLNTSSNVYNFIETALCTNNRMLSRVHVELWKDVKLLPKATVKQQVLLQNDQWILSYIHYDYLIFDENNSEFFVIVFMFFTVYIVSCYII